MDYTTVPIDNYSTPGFATSTNYDVPPPVVYAYGGVQPEKNYSIPTIVFSSISLVTFGLWTFFSFIIAILASIDPYASGGIIAAWWIVTIYCFTKCVSSILLVVGSNRSLRALLFLNIVYLGFFGIIECILFVVFFIILIYGFVYLWWFFLLWAATELVTVLTVVISGMRLRHILKTQFGPGAYGYQDTSYEMAQDYSYSDNQYSV